MKIKQLWIGTIAVELLAASAGISASLPNTPGGDAQTVITVHRSSDRNLAVKLNADDLMVLHGKTRLPIVRLQRLTGEMPDMQLFVLLDDSTRSSSLGIQLAELKTFLTSLPDTTEVAIGYMRNGTFGLVQPFTADHAKAASALRLPIAVPGTNGSPYFALSDLVEHWPSKQSTDRRAVLMLTDGVDRYYSAATPDDPYVDSAVHQAWKKGVMVYSVYLRGAGFSGRGGWVTNIAQSRLIQASQDTGGYAYFEGFSDPVTISPFLNDLKDRFQNQYQVTIKPLNEKGFQAVKWSTELPGLKISGPTHIYVQ